jgi:hypothetical protein
MQRLTAEAAMALFLQLYIVFERSSIKINTVRLSAGAVLSYA